MKHLASIKTIYAQNDGTLGEIAEADCGALVPLKQLSLSVYLVNCPKCINSTAKQHLEEK